MENVIEHGGAESHDSHEHHHEVELSVSPLIVSVGGFLIPISFITAFPWGMSFAGLLIAAVAIVLMIVGLYMWTTEIYAHKKDVGLSKVAIIFFIFSEMALFGGLFFGYLYNMLPAEVWPPANTPEGVPPLGLAIVMSVFLISSSFTIHIGEEKLDHGDAGGFKTWLIITIILGVLFTALMAFEWYELMHQKHFSISTNAYSTFFFTITGFHASHVLVGLIMQVFCVIMARRFTKEKQTLAKTTGIYWHFVDGIWLLVVSLIYIVPYFSVGH